MDKKTEKQVKKLLSTISELVTLDIATYDQVATFRNNIDLPTEMEDKGAVDFEYLFDVVYYLFRGQSEQETYRSFRAPSEDSNKPVAWYKTEFNSPKDGYIKGPTGFTGFIPDEINMLITSRKVDPSRKFKLLTVMFKDLKTLEESYVQPKRKAAKK